MHYLYIAIFNIVLAICIAGCSSNQEVVNAPKQVTTVTIIPPPSPDGVEFVVNDRKHTGNQLSPTPSLTMPKSAPVPKINP
jgi:hypothetical protein